MSLPLMNLHKIDTTGIYVVETDIDIPLPTAPPNANRKTNVVRANVYRPKDSFTDGKRYPVLVTYGPCKHRINHFYIAWLDQQLIKF
jgi:hypothetical protein